MPSSKFFLSFGFVLLFVAVLFLVSPYSKFMFTSAVSSFRMEILPICGNGEIDDDEQCDGVNLVGEDCVSMGFIRGTLACSSECVFNTSQCTLVGLGGWSSSDNDNVVVVVSKGFTKATFSGKSYPLSKVSVLKDGQLGGTTLADSAGNFYVQLSGLSFGNYNFSVFAEDVKGKRSSLVTFRAVVNRDVSTNFNGIFIAPTITVDKNNVKKGDTVVVSGQSLPNAQVFVYIGLTQELVQKVVSDNNGFYSAIFKISYFDIGNYSARSKAFSERKYSPFSSLVNFAVNHEDVSLRPAAECPLADLNNDCRVNLVDFSIAAYWYERPFTSSFAALEAKKLSGDGKIDLVDFSIMAFYWTG